MIIAEDKISNKRDWVEGILVKCNCEEFKNTANWYVKLQKNSNK